MTGWYGLNYHPSGEGAPDHEAMLQSAERLNARWQLVMDSDSFATQLVSRCPNTNVIFRAGSDAPFRDTIENGKVTKRAQSGGEWLDANLANGSMLHPRQFLQYANEAGHDKEYIEATKEVVSVSKARGWPARLCLVNASSGTGGMEEWARWHDVIKLAGENPQHLVIGLHEYFDTLPVTGISGVALEAPDVYDMRKWPTRAQLVDGRPLWHVGRFRFLLQYCAKHNIPTPRIVINEHGSDRMNDVDRFTRNWFYHEPNAQHGPLNCTPSWLKWYPNLTPEHIFLALLEYCRHEIYAGSPAEGAILYCECDSSGKQRRWKWFDMRYWHSLKTGLAVANRELTPLPPPAPTPQPDPTPTPAPLPDDAADILEWLSRLETRVSGLEKTLHRASDVITDAAEKAKAAHETVEDLRVKLNRYADAEARNATLLLNETKDK